MILSCSRRFSSARDFGEEMIREQYVELLRSPAAMAALAGGKKSQREFNRLFIRPIDLRLQRWRRHTRRRVTVSVMQLGRQRHQVQAVDAGPNKSSLSFGCWIADL